LEAEDDLWGLRPSKTKEFFEVKEKKIMKTAENDEDVIVSI